jgi:FkbM family methyltransferase
MTMFKWIKRLPLKPKGVIQGNKVSILNELKKEPNILNPDEIVEQITDKKKMIRFLYKNNTLYYPNEPSLIYHLVNSVRKIENLVNSIDEECKIVLDIGSHVGLFSFFLKKKFPDSFIYLFEADEKLIPVIHKNLQFTKNFEILNLAVSDKDNGMATFFINPQSTQTNSTIKEAVTIFEKEENLILKNIKTVTIDSFCKMKNIDKVDVIKIDIQGGELKALEKASDTLFKTNILLAELSFFVSDTYELLTFIKKYYKKDQAINDVFMGADIKFYN